MGDRRVLLVTGSRALAKTPAARQWACARLCEHFAWLLDGPDPLVIHGGCRGSPDAWSGDLAGALDLRQRVYLANGRMEVYQGRRQTEACVWSTSPGTPLDRNRYMVETVARKLQGLPLRVLALRASWATTHGTEHTITLARGAGLDVVELVCPPELGPTEGR